MFSFLWTIYFNGVNMPNFKWLKWFYNGLRNDGTQSIMVIIFFKKPGGQFSTTAQNTDITKKI